MYGYFQWIFGTFQRCNDPRECRRHKPRGLSLKMIHDEWKCYFIRKNARSNAPIRRQKSQPFAHPSVDSSPEISWRNLAWRFSRNKYIHTRAPVCARACTNTLLSRDHHHPAISCVLARTPSRTTSNRDIRISILIHSPRWPFARFDASYIWNSSSLSLSLSLSIRPSIFFRLSLVVYFLLWLPILIISVRAVSISVCKMQDEDYIFFA